VIHPSKVLASLDQRALKSFGQNFLVSQSSLVSLEKHFDIKKPVLEIGPGLGAITEYLVNKKFTVVAIEKDPKLAVYLKDRFKEFQESVEVINADFLELSPEFFKERGITQIMGNLPFYITSDILTKVISETNVDVFVMGIQKEVGERLLKESGNSPALYVKANGDIVDHRVIGKNNFYPVPDVNAMWLTWKRNQKIENMNLFEVFLRGIFWGKRKNFFSVLLKNPFFEKVPETQRWHKNIMLMQIELTKLRADQLSFEEIKDIFLRITT
jgi:16S rRNA (adenine1518-N6/adenine1519-N6)-dimethyltransferase